MSSSEPVRALRRFGAIMRIGAIVSAERAVDAYADAHCRAEDRGIARDILRRNLARMPLREPALDGFIGEVESCIGLLHGDLARRAA